MGEIQQYLTFMLGGEMFAMGILTVKEIIEYANLTEVPMMPASVRGVINLRGAVVPVADLAVRFGRAAAPVTKRTCIVIVEVTLNGERQDVGARCRCRERSAGYSGVGDRAAAVVRCAAAHGLHPGAWAR